MRKQPTFGALYGLYGGGESPAYMNEMGAQVWMYREGQEIRLFDHDGDQVGPEHASVVPATVWAFAHGWVNHQSPAWLDGLSRNDTRI